MKITTLEPAAPTVAPFVPFTITVETPEEAACLAAACGQTSPFCCAAEFTSSARGYMQRTRFKTTLTQQDIEDSRASTAVFRACTDALR